MYLDNAATTKVHPLVKKEMDKASFANYNAKYYPSALETKTQINDAISTIAKCLDIDEKRIVITSGATESNNYIIKGLFSKYPNKHFICSTIEHKSVLGTFEYLETLGMNVDYVKPNKNGQITKQSVADLICEDTVLVSVMYVNNETGVINEIPEISDLCKEKDILFHSDVVQAIGKCQVDFSKLNYASISAHKISGPKGVGLAIIDPENKPVPLLHGSTQQNNNRAGTLPNELILGIAKALDLAINNFEENHRNILNNRKKIIEFLDENLGDDYYLNFTSNTVDNIVHVGIKGEINQIFLSDNAEMINASTGSACSIAEPSYVLKECGFTDQKIRESIRLSLPMYGMLDE